MSLSIVNNSTAIGAQGSVNNANNNLTKTIKALSTGLRINTAADDASGLAVSEKLRAQISGLNKAATNAQDAISMLQTAEGAMGSMTSMVQRIRELAVQAGDPAYTSNDRAMLQLEVDQLKEEIDRVSSSSEFNTKKLLNGDAAALWSASNDDIEAIIKGAPVEGNYKITYDVDPGQNSVYKSNIMRLGKGEMSYDVDRNGTSITKFDNIQGMLRGEDFQVTVKGSAAITAGSAVVTGSTGKMTTGTIANTFNTNSAAVTGNNSYSIEIEAIGKKTANGTGQIKFRVMNTKTGELSEWVTATVNATGNVLNGSAISSNLAGIERSVFNSGIVTFTANTEWDAGDKILINVASGRAGGADAGTVQIGSTGSTVHITAGFTNSATATTHTIHTAQMDKAGNVYYGSMDFTMEKGKAVSGTATIDILGEGDVASKYTKLSQIESFTNADGRNVLDNTQEISIYAGNGKQAKVTLEGSDSIKDLESKLTQALVDQLGLGADVTNPAATEINKNLVKFVEDEGGKGDRAVKGTFVIQGALLGDKSNLTFVGDEGVLNGLGVTQIQEAKDSALNVRVSDAHTGEFIGEDTVTDGRLRNIIPGVDLEIKPESAANVNFDAVKNQMVFEAKADPTTAFLHIKDNATKAAIGANEGQILDISIGRLDTKSMGIEDVNVATFADAQKSITKLDMALEQISKARATAGAQMNRLDYTINNLNTTRENMVAAESRIRDLDIAQASSQLAAQQVLMQSATAMLAQANQIPSYAMQLMR